MLADDDQAANRTEALDEQAGRRRRPRPFAGGVVSLAAAIGLLAGGLTACSSSSAPARTAPGPAHAAQTPTHTARPRTGGLNGNPLLDTAVAPQISAAAADVGLPRYYIVDSDPKLAALQVRSSITGKVISTVSPPAACDPKTLKIAAAANNQDFVLGCATSQKTVFYRFQLTSDGLASALTPLSIPGPDNSPNDMALNADGSKLAIGLQNPGAVEVVTLATGAVRSWTAQGAFPLELSWADSGREVSFFGSGGLYVLDVSAAGSSLHAARLVLPRTVQSDAVQNARLSPDGTTIIAAVDYSNLGAKLGRHSVVGGIVEISATTRKPLRTLLAQHAHYSIDGGGHEAGWYVSSCDLGALDATGDHLLVSCDQFGRLDRGRFTPLPGPGPLNALYTSAW